VHLFVSPKRNTFPTLPNLIAQLTLANSTYIKLFVMYFFDPNLTFPRHFVINSINLCTKLPKSMDGNASDCKVTCLKIVLITVWQRPPFSKHTFKMKSFPRARKSYEAMEIPVNCHLPR
jgi:hypothetical protein